MAYQHNSSKHQRRRQRRMWPLLAALWAAVGLSPCALAAVGNLDCLHCPVESAGKMHEGHSADDMHAMHDENHGAAGDCGDDCLDADDSLVDARNLKTSSKDGDDVPAIVALTQDPTKLVFARSHGGVDPPRIAPVPRERLHAIHCVFLD